MTMGEKWYIVIVIQPLDWLKVNMKRLTFAVYTAYGAVFEILCEIYHLRKCFTFLQM